MIHVDVVYIGCTYSRTYVVASWLLYKHCTVNRAKKMQEAYILLP
jgi:hypothetical protein